VCGDIFQKAFLGVNLSATPKFGDCEGEVLICIFYISLTFYAQQKNSQSPHGKLEFLVVNLNIFFTKK
jgi:hypothetical protein